MSTNELAEIMQKLREQCKQHIHHCIGCPLYVLWHDCGWFEEITDEEIKMIKQQKKLLDKSANL